MNREQRIAWLNALMKGINANNGTINCATVALRLDEFLNNPELANNSLPVSKQDGKLQTNPLYTQDGAGVVRSFCADPRILARCVRSISNGIITDISDDQEVILLDEETKINTGNIKLNKISRQNSVKYLQNLPRRNRDGTAQGFIFYTHIGKNSGHVANFFVDANDEVYFLDAQNNNDTNSFVLSSPAHGYREEFFYVQSQPAEGFKPIQIKKNPNATSSAKKNPPNWILLDNPTVDEIYAVPAHLRALSLQNASVDAVKAVPAHVKSLLLHSASVDAVKAVPAHVALLTLENASVDAVKAAPAHLRALSLQNASVDAVKAVPAHVKWLALKNASVDAVKAVPAHVKALILENASIDAAKATPAHVIILKIQINEADKNQQQYMQDLKKFFKSHRPDLKLYYGNVLVIDSLGPLPQAVTTTAPASKPLTVVAPVIPPGQPPMPAILPFPTVPAPFAPLLPPPPQTFNYDALKADNEMLRKRLKAEEAVSAAKDVLIQALRESLAKYENSATGASQDNDAKRARIGQ